MSRKFGADECKELIQRCENKGLVEVERSIALYNRSVIIDPDLATKLYTQLKDIIPSTFNGQQVVGLNDHFRFSKYDPGGRFEMHKDGFNQDSKGNRSAMTLNIFLNDDFEGGETDFFDDNKSFIFSAKPKPGRGALFDSQHYHQGNVVRNGNKYLLRTDVMVGI